MTKPYAFVFPGQGSQFVGMYSGFKSEFSQVKHLFDAASEVLGSDIWQLIEAGPEEKLNQTEYTQPALLTCGVATWELWRQKGVADPKFLAGHSLGEYTALVCTGALDFQSAVNIVNQRGKFMQAAVPSGTGSMAAIIGLSDEAVADVCDAVSQNNSIVSPANYNSIGQVVIAGDNEAVERAIILAKEQGAKLAKKLPVSVPSHCELMKPAAIKLAEILNNTVFKQPTIPVINNVDVQNYTHSEQIKDALIRQLYSPVRWVETVQYFDKHAIEGIIESGPGKVLTALNKRIVNTMTALCIEQPDALQAAVEFIGD